MEVAKVLVVLALAFVAALAHEAGFIEDVRGNSPSRIVAGWEADPGQFPHQLSIRMVYAQGSVGSCGGSIIHREWGLTAAHCSVQAVHLVIRAGAANLTQPALMFETPKYYNHPLYDESRPGNVQPNDIALVEFEKAIEFNELVQPIRLQRSAVMNKDYNGQKTTASGYGRVWTNSGGSEVLNWVYLNGIENQRCRNIYGAIVENSTICTLGYNDTAQSTCQGDSGGPLTIIDDDGELTQIGVTSFVFALGCHLDFPAGFIRPGHYHGWFTDVTGVDFDWRFDDDITYPEVEEGYHGVVNFVG